MHRCIALLLGRIHHRGPARSLAGRNHVNVKIIPSTPKYEDQIGGYELDVSSLHLNIEFCRHKQHNKEGGDEEIMSASKTHIVSSCLNLYRNLNTIMYGFP